MFSSRQQIVADKLSPISAIHMARQYVRRAEVAVANGNPERAARFAELRLWLDPENKAAIQLRTDLEEQVPPRAVRGGSRTARQARAACYQGGSVEPWMIDELGPHAAGLCCRMQMRDPGVPGYSRDVGQPGDASHAPQ